MANRLPTNLDLTERLPAIYTGDAAVVPVGDTRFRVRIRRPNSLIGETDWPDRGTGGKPAKLALDRLSGAQVDVLDTEVIRAFIFLSLDAGSTWKQWGHIGTTGGAIFNRRGDIVLESTYTGRLPEPLNPSRILRVVLDVGEKLTTEAVIDTDAFRWPLVERGDIHRSVAVESVADGNAGVASSVSSSGNVSPAGSDRYLAIMGGNGRYPSVAGYSSMAFGATTATQIQTASYSYYRASMAKVVAPSTTPAAVSYVIDATDDHLFVCGVAFSGVDQTTPNDSAPSQTNVFSTSGGASITKGEDGDVRIAAVMVGYGEHSGVTVGSGETERSSLVGEGGSYDNAFAVSTKADDGTDNMDFSWGLTTEALIVGYNINQASATATLAQAAFRFGDDDGSESAYTQDTQDANKTVAVTTNFIYRALLQGSGDPASVAYTLRAQKNGSGGYSVVGVGTTGPGATPVIETADAVESGDNNTTPTTPWPVTRRTASTGDLIVMVLAWDDSTNNTGVTPANGPNGETWTQIDSVQASASTEIRMTAYYTVATGAWGAGTIAVTPNANEQWTACMFSVPSGEFDASTPIGAADTAASAGTAESTINSPALTVGSSDGGGRLIFCGAADADPQTSLGGGYTQITNTDRGNVSLSVNSRDAAVTNSQSLSAGDGTQTIASDSWASLAFVVRAPIVSNEIYVATSSNITAGGEATTNRMTGGTGSFVTGRIWDNENGSDSIDITEDDFTEVAWCCALASSLSPGDYFDLRVYAGASPLDTYTATGRVTVAGGGGDPESGLIGGKLLRGGLLLRGALVH